MVELFVFAVAGLVCLSGAIGVIASRNPVHAALSLVATLFGIAVLFVAQEAHFLAAVQVIVYAGAIVVLFLFVIMFLGVDRAEDLRVEPLGGQRIAAGVLGIGVVALVVAALASTSFEATGISGDVGPLPEEGAYDISLLSEALFTKYVFAFELTSVLLVIAVVGAVVLARRSRRAEEIVDPGQEERAEQVAERIARAEARARVYERNPRGGEAGGAAAAPADEPAEEPEEVTA
ncbi:MAG TPA: NADH-quinone oxidoreductase subunit J [Acidimicrobiales bacterium]